MQRRVTRVGRRVCICTSRQQPFHCRQNAMLCSAVMPCPSRRSSTYDIYKIHKMMNKPIMGSSCLRRSTKTFFKLCFFFCVHIKHLFETADRDTEPLPCRRRSLATCRYISLLLRLPQSGDSTIVSQSFDDNVHRWSSSRIGRPTIDDQLQQRTRHFVRYHITIQYWLFIGGKTKNFEIMMMKEIFRQKPTLKLRSTISLCN